MSKLSTEDRLEIAVRLMPKRTKDSYRKIVRYCEANEKAVRDLRPVDLCLILSEKISEIDE